MPGPVRGPSLSRTKLRDGTIIARGAKVTVSRPAWSGKVGTYTGKDARSGKLKVEFCEHGGAILLCEKFELLAV